MAAKNERNSTHLPEIHLSQAVRGGYWNKFPPLKGGWIFLCLNNWGRLHNIMFIIIIA